MFKFTLGICAILLTISIGKFLDKIDQYYDAQTIWALVQTQKSLGNPTGVIPKSKEKGA